MERDHNKISQTLTSLRDGEEACAIAMAKVLNAETTTFLTGQFSESIQITTRAYSQFPAGVGAEDYAKRLVSYGLAKNNSIALYVADLDGITLSQFKWTSTRRWCL
jgi:hypothetical protein